MDHLKMYFLDKMVIFQFSMLVFRRVIFHHPKKNWKERSLLVPSKKMGGTQRRPKNPVTLGILGRILRMGAWSLNTTCILEVIGHPNHLRIRRLMPREGVTIHFWWPQVLAEQERRRSNRPELPLAPPTATGQRPGRSWRGIDWTWSR